jgi:AraC family transcriptional regulator
MNQRLEQFCARKLFANKLLLILCNMQLSMVNPQDLFLGNNRLIKHIGGTTIALTVYGVDPEFEEWHSHKNNSISLLLAGTHAENLQGRQINRVPGDLKFIPAGVLHRCEKYIPGTRKINLDLDHNALAEMNITEEQLCNLSENSFSSKFTLLKLYHELADNDSHASASAQILLYELFNPPTPLKRTRGSARPIWVVQLTALLNDEWNNTFHLNELAIRLGVHPVTISRYFPLYFSSTLGSYILRIKINKAMVLIKESNMPLTEIAYTCGFADQAHFTRTFKNMTGYLPKQFRNV